MFVLLILITILTLLVAWYAKKETYIRQCLKNFPHAPDLPIVGCALDFVGDKGMLEVLRKYQQEYGDIVYGKVGPSNHVLFFTSPDFAKTIFHSNTNLSKGTAYDFAKPWLREGLLTTPEEKWKIQRKMMTPAFSNQLLIDFLAVFDEQSTILIEKIESISPVKSVNILPLINFCSLDIICETSMGVSLNTQQNANKEYACSIKEMCRIIADRSISLLKQFNLLYLFTPDYQCQRRCLNILHSFTNKVIQERKKDRKNCCLLENKKPKKLVLLDILLDYSEKENPLSEVEIRQEVNTFLFAGHDTVTTAMSFFLFEIAKHPEIQKNVYEEQENIFGKNLNRKTTLDDVHAMRYLELVIKEVLRMYPPVPVYTRKVTKEFIYDGHTIPKDITLIHFAYGLHRNEKVFPNPETFDPLRFINMDEKSFFSFLPFSTGPRNCIGQKFAMYEMKVILSKVLRHFEIRVAEPEHTIQLRAEVVLLSRNGINVKIIPRILDSI